MQADSRFGKYSQEDNDEDDDKSSIDYLRRNSNASIKRSSNESLRDMDTNQPHDTVMMRGDDLHGNEPDLLSCATHASSIYQPPVGAVINDLISNKNDIYRTKSNNRVRRQYNPVGSTRFMMIDPNSKERTYWDIIIGGCILYSGVFVPLSIAFAASKNRIGFFGIIELITDFLLLLDVLANFRTGFYDRHGKLVMDPRACRNRYLKTWFIIDLAASLPFDLMLAPIQSANAFKSTSVQVMRLARLLRFSRLFRSIDKLQKIVPTVSSSVLRMVKLLLSISLFAHFDACAMYFAARMDNSAESWIDTNSLEDETRFVQYLWSLFMALSHMLCIGYGPTGAPGTITELSMTIMSMLIGASLYVILIGLITANLMSFNNTASQLDRVEDTKVDDRENAKGNLKKTPPSFVDSNHTTPCSSRRSSLNMAQLNNLSHHVLLLVASALSSSDLVSASASPELQHRPTSPTNSGQQVVSASISTFQQQDNASLGNAASFKMFLLNKDMKTDVKQVSDTCSRLTSRRSSI